VSGTVVTYKVVAGDTVWALAVRYHTTVTAIVQANNLKSANLIIVGQTLKIPT
jgi:LysM repeat protein